MEDQEVLGDSLIPVINRLQDIFSQVGRARSYTIFEPSWAPMYAPLQAYGM